MTITENRTATTGGDAAAIAELQEIVERQRAAFLADPFPSLEERQGLLGALAGMVMSHRTQIQEAMSSDFGVHPPLATDLIEVLGRRRARRVRRRAPRRAGWRPSRAKPTRRCTGPGAPSSSPSPRASWATSSPGTSRSTSRSARSSRCSPPAIVS